MNRVIMDGTIWVRSKHGLEWFWALLSLPTLYKVRQKPGQLKPVKRKTPHKTLTAESSYRRVPYIRKKADKSRPNRYTLTNNKSYQSTSA